MTQLYVCLFRDDLVDGEHNTSLCLLNYTKMFINGIQVRIYAGLFYRMSYLLHKYEGGPASLVCCRLCCYRLVYLTKT